MGAAPRKPTQETRTRSRQLRALPDSTKEIRVPQDYRGHVDSQKPIPTGNRGNAVGEHGKGEGESRVKSLVLQLKPVYGGYHSFSHSVTQDASHRHLLREHYAETGQAEPRTDIDAIIPSVRNTAVASLLQVFYIHVPGFWSIARPPQFRGVMGSLQVGRDGAVRRVSLWRSRCSCHTTVDVLEFNVYCTACSNAPAACAAKI